MDDTIDSDDEMVREENRSNWFFCMEPRPEAVRRLFCFPFAGGGASVFNTWVKPMGVDVELRTLQLPGRETRYKEPFRKDMHQLIFEIVDALSCYQDKPCGFFGYSLGALIAFEVCRGLRRINLKLPEYIFIGASQAPQNKPALPPISLLPEKEFAEKVDLYFQPDDPAWKHPELRQMILPVLQNDLALAESYKYTNDKPLQIPLYIFSGNQDRAVPIESTSGWSEQTTEGVYHYLFSGGHFFINNALDDIHSIIATILNK